MISSATTHRLCPCAGRPRIRSLALEPFFNAITETGQANRNLLRPTDAKIADLIGVTSRLLTHTNSLISAARADTRSDIIRLQRLSAAIVAVLAFTIGILLFNLMRQVGTMKAAAAVLEATASELTTAYEAAEAGNRAKSEFMAVMGHEIRTPLNAILGMAEILSHDQMDQAARERVGIITSSGTILLEMLNEILDYAKIEHGKMTSEAVAFDVRQLAADTLRVIEGRAAERNNRLEVNHDGLHAAGWHTGDPTLIRRVLLNFLSNAAKFTENGIIRLKISSDRNRLRAEVCDTGIGISAEARDKLFSAFTQVDSSIGRRFGGTGLGLAICKRIIEELGARSVSTARLASAASSGSRFPPQLPKLRPGTIAFRPARRRFRRAVFSSSKTIPSTGRSPRSSWACSASP